RSDCWSVYICSTDLSPLCRSFIGNERPPHRLHVRTEDVRHLCRCVCIYSKYHSLSHDAECSRDWLGLFNNSDGNDCDGFNPTSPSGGRDGVSRIVGYFGVSIWTVISFNISCSCIIFTIIFNQRWSWIRSFVIIVSHSV